MSGIRVSGITNSLEMMEIDLKIYFSKQSNGGGAVSKIYYPLLNNDAVVIFKDPRVVDTVVTVSHVIRDMKLSVQALPRSVFVKIEATLNTEISALISATEKCRNHLKKTADLELKFNEANDEWILCGNVYQVEWAWNSFNNLLERQLSIHSKVLSSNYCSVGESSSENVDTSHDEKRPGIGRSRQASGARHVDGESKTIPKVGKKKTSPSARSKDENNKPFLSEILSKECEHDQNVNMSLLTTEVKMNEKSERWSSSCSDSETGGISFDIDRSKSGIKHRKPRRKRNAHPTQIQEDADRTFEEFSKMNTMKVTENTAKQISLRNNVSRKSHERENTEYEKGSHSHDDQEDDQENNPSLGTALAQSTTNCSLKRPHPHPVDNHVTKTEPRNISDVDSESYAQSRINPENVVQWDGSNENFKFIFRDISVYVLCDDITKERTDAIVNAAIGTLINGAGVARAIARAASPTMQQECDRHVKQNGPLKTSEVVHTRAGGSLSKDVCCVLHTVGPIWFDDDRERCFHELTKTFRNCLIYANKKRLKSLSLPTISSGIFQVPLDICILSFFEAFLLFANETVTDIYLTEIHLVNNDPNIVLQCVNYLQIILCKDLEVSLARAIERFKNFELDKERQFSHRSKGISKSYHSKEVSSDKKIDCSNDTRNGSRMSEKRSAERWSLSLNQTVSKKSFSESRQDGKTTNPKCRSHSSVARVTSQPGDMKPKSNNTNKSGPMIKQRPLSACLRVNGKNKDGDASTYDHKAGTESVDHGKTNIAWSAFEDYSKIKFPPQQFKQSLSTKSKTQNEKPRRIEERETKSFHKPVKADISLDDMLVTSLKQRDYKVGHDDLDGCLSMPNIDAADLKQKTFGRRDEASTVPKNSEKEMCPICLDEMSSPKTLTKCYHKFCKECIEEQFLRGKPVCPCCGTVYGIVKGDQPKGGEMTCVVKRNIHIPGIKDSTGAILITYNIPGGQQEAHHPNPGRYFSGITRTAFLPYNKEGREIAKLLEKAFNAGLMFTIGQSRTTGSEGVVTWNDIHHKTNVDGGPLGFGYPDPTYLNRVREELAAKGITTP